MRITATIRRDGDWFVAQALEVDVASQGKTIEESLANLREAIELYLEDADELPPPTEPALVTTIEVPLRAVG
jgi:predicted RNase H-like HicB family nuclease